MKTSIVIGLGFGDEGKGMVTSSLALKTNNPIVVRFSGGHNAGHTVVNKGKWHIFSNFGSATMQGVPTYWSKYGTFNPGAVLKEYEALRQYNPVLYVDGLCPVTTPFDMLHNIKCETENNHGSCGIGFGSTIQRQENYYKLYVQDLYFPSVYEAKLENIIRYYHDLLPGNWEQIAGAFITEVEWVKNIIRTDVNLKYYDHLIFEGSQGVLLDMDFGFFPNVTRANTTSKNALKILKDFAPLPEIYYVTRSYQTRHGNGFMTNEGLTPVLINNENETNVTDRWQGKFRTGALDIDLINYAIKCDDNFSGGCAKNLIVTCLDQTGYEIPYSAHGIQTSGSVYHVIDNIDVQFKNIYISESPESELVKLIKTLKLLNN